MQHILKGILREVKQRDYKGAPVYDAVFSKTYRDPDSDDELKVYQNVSLRPAEVVPLEKLVGKVVVLACKAKAILTKKGTAFLMLNDGHLVTLK